MFRMRAAVRVQPDAAKQHQDLWRIYIPVLGLVGIGAELLYVTQVPGHLRWGVFGTALAIGGASALVGGIVGLLFGVPLANQNTDDQYRPNVNLEQVSDWLTKILVGVGLVQIGHALPALSKLARNLKTPLGGLASSSAFGLGIVMYFALLGFLLLYLWAKLILPFELPETVEQMTRQIATRAATAAATTAATAQISRTDSARADALRLVNQQLNLGKGGAPPAAGQLNQAVAAAPDSTRLLIFNQAEQFRRNAAAQIRQDLDGTRRSEQGPRPGDDPATQARKAKLRQDQDLMALAIPVFQALVAADTGSQDHRSHGCLGWALKDKAGPPATDTQTWRDAASALDAAIDIRDRLGVIGWKLYEANRAVCNINLRQILPDADPLGAALDAQIQHDLDEARDDERAAPMVDPDPHSPTADPDISRWLNR